MKLLVEQVSLLGQGERLGLLVAIVLRRLVLYLRARVLWVLVVEISALAADIDTALSAIPSIRLLGFFAMSHAVEAAVPTVHIRTF